MNKLTETLDLLCGDGEPISGANLLLEEAIALGEQHCGHKPYCVVADWILVDLDLNEQAAAEFVKATGLQPKLVYAHKILFDSSHKFAPGNWVRTTAMLTFTEPGLFETSNTLYVLLGEGKRKTAKAETIMGIF